MTLAHGKLTNETCLINAIVSIVIFYYQRRAPLAATCTEKRGTKLQVWVLMFGMTNGDFICLLS